MFIDYAKKSKLVNRVEGRPDLQDRVMGWADGHPLREFAVGVVGAAVLYLYFYVGFGLAVTLGM